MSGAIPARSLLKQKTTKKPAVPDEQKARVEQDRKNLGVALKHAYLIQHRKDVEAAILVAITTLIDLPAAPKVTSKEAVTFLNLVKPFQPSDYDSLIEERYIDGKCGYALCSNAPRSESTGQNLAWKLRKGMRNWCSDSCAQKGLYIKTQLSEVPAWERLPEQQPDLVLREDDQTLIDASPKHVDRTIQTDPWRKKMANDKELAMERGERMTSLKPNRVMAETIVEKLPKEPQGVDNIAVPGHYSAIEGYRPKRAAKKSNTASDESDSDAVN